MKWIVQLYNLKSWIIKTEVPFYLCNLHFCLFSVLFGFLLFHSCTGQFVSQLIQITKTHSQNHINLKKELILKTTHNKFGTREKPTLAISDSFSSLSFVKSSLIFSSSLTLPGKELLHFRRLERVFRCCSVCETTQDYKEGYLMVWTNYMSPCSSIVGLYFKGTCDVISVTMATYKSHKSVF